MTFPIPKQLLNPDFRFHLISRGKKKPPIERQWNKEGGNNYPFFQSKLINHIENGGNYGVCCGFGNLIVLDFDDGEFYKKVSGQLPKTFTVRSATKHMPHCYYYLDGEMVKKIGIDIKGKRVCDIQAAQVGVVGPGSHVDRKYYDILIDKDIAHITMTELQRILRFSPSYIKKPRVFTGIASKPTNSALDGQKTVDYVLGVLTHHKIKRTQEWAFKCPFHASASEASLRLFPDTGHLHCFHCERHFANVDHFIREYELWKQIERTV